MEYFVLNGYVRCSMAFIKGFSLYSKVLFIPSRMVSESFQQLVYEYYAFFPSLLQFNILGVQIIGER